MASLVELVIYTLSLRSSALQSVEKGETSGEVTKTSWRAKRAARGMGEERRKRNPFHSQLASLTDSFLPSRLIGTPSYASYYTLSFFLSFFLGTLALYYCNGLVLSKVMTIMSWGYCPGGRCSHLDLIRISLYMTFKADFCCKPGIGTRLEAPKSVYVSSVLLITLIVILMFILIIIIIIIIINVYACNLDVIHPMAARYLRIK